MYEFIVINTLPLQVVVAIFSTTILLCCCFLSLRNNLQINGLTWASMALGLLCGMVFFSSAEDAFITYRYSEFLAQGFGPVWNIGERVEGYSNFLWMVFIAALHKGTGIDIPFLGKCLGAFFTILSIDQFGKLLKLCDAPDRAVFFGLVSYTTFAGVGVYCFSGMESPLFIYLLILTYCSIYQKKYTLAGLSSTGLLLCRPEGLLIFAVLFFHVFLAEYHTPRLAKKLAQTFIIPVISAGFFYAFKYFYYGYFVPNSAAAKHVPFRSAIFVGKQDLIEFCSASNFVLVLGFGLIAVAWRLFKKKLNVKTSLGLPYDLRFYSLVLGIFLFWCFYVVAGGDWMPGWRYLTHTYFMVVACLVFLMVRMEVKFRGIVFAVLVFLFVGKNLDVAWHHNQGLKRVREWSSSADRFERLGRSMNLTFPEKDILMAVQGAGALPFYSKLPTVDELGLTDKHIARHGKRRPLYGQRIQGHLAVDYDYVFETRKPDVLLQGAGEKGIASPDYEFVQLTDGLIGVTYKIYVRKERWDFIQKKFLARKSVDFKFEKLPFEATEAPSDAF
jgi:arabinofuranosyltransferase